MKLKNALIIDGQVYIPRTDKPQGLHPDDRIRRCSFCALDMGEENCPYCAPFNDATHYLHEGRLMDTLISREEDER